MLIKGIHAFVKSISPKVKQIERVGFELTYKDVTVQNFSSYPTGTFLQRKDQTHYLAVFDMQH